MKTTFYLTAIGLAGLVTLASPAFAHDGDGSGRPGHHHMGCDTSLSPDKEKLVHDAMRASFEKNKGLFEKMRGLHEKMHGIISADKFDKDAFIATRKEITAQRAEMENSRAEAMAGVMAQLTPKERESVMRDMMMKRHGHDHGDRGRWFHHDRDSDRGAEMGPGPASAPATNNDRSWDKLNQ